MSDDLIARLKDPTSREFNAEAAAALEAQRAVIVEVIEVCDRAMSANVLASDAGDVAMAGMGAVVKRILSGQGATELMVDDEDRVIDWLASSSAARIARVVACGQKVLDERFADGVFE
jgi:hypothetical protein